MKKILFFAFVFFASCSNEPNYNAQGWKPEYRAKIKNKWMNASQTPNKVEDQILKEKICDCLVKKLEEKYPYGLPSNLPQNLVLNISIDCIPKNQFHTK